MFKPLRILDLPYFAREETVRGMEIIDMYNLKSLSKRSCCVVRAASRVMGQLNIKITFFGTITISLTKGNHEQTVGSICVPTTGNPYDYTKNVVQFLAEEFKNSNVSVSHFDSFSPDFPLEHIITDFLPFLKTLKLKFHNFFFDCKRDIEDETIKSVMNECQHANSLELIAETAPIFQLDLGEMHCEKLNLFCGTLVTADHVINCFMDCKSVNLICQGLDSHHIPLIIEKWEKGSRLEELSILCATESHSMLSIFPEVLEEQTGLAVVIIGNDCILMQRYLVIQQENGKEAIVGIGTDEYFSTTLLLSTNFEIY